MYVLLLICRFLLFAPDDYLALWKQMFAKKQQSSQPNPVASRPTAALPYDLHHTASTHTTHCTLMSCSLTYVRI